MPIEYCDEITNPRLRNDAKSLLGKSSRLDFLMFTPSARKMEKNPKLMICLITIITISVGIQIATTFPRLGKY